MFSCLAYSSPSCEVEEALGFMSFWWICVQGSDPFSSKHTQPGGRPWGQNTSQPQAQCFVSAPVSYDGTHSWPGMLRLLITMVGYTSGTSP
jgi:hypothetical protein